MVGTLFVADTMRLALWETTLVMGLRRTTILGVNVGRGRGLTGVHVYQRVASLAALTLLRRAAPATVCAVSAGAGESCRQRLPLAAGC